MATTLDKTFIAAVLLMIGLLVIVVNLLTIVVVLRTPQLRHSEQWQANMYVLSLAVADTLVGAAIVWMACLFIPEARAIIDRSYVLCMSGAIVNTIFVTVSHVTLLVIALDRLCYIVYPFFYGRFVSARLTKALIVTIWCLSVIISCTIIVLHNGFVTGGCKLFGRGNVYEKIFLNGSLLGEFLLSGACYIWIACIVRNHRRRIRTILQVTANISSKDNCFLCRDNLTTPEDKEVRSNTTICKSAKNLSAEEDQENGHLEPQILPTCQDECNSDMTLQAGPDCQVSSEVVLASHLHVTGVLQSADVDVSLTTRKTEKRTGFAMDISAVSKACISHNDSKLKKSQCIGMFVTINILFSVSWIPFVVHSIFFDKGLDNDEGTVVAILMPVYANSLLNFAVYTWKNIEYRKAYKRLFMTSIHCVLMRQSDS